MLEREKRVTEYGIDLQLIATWDALQRKVEVIGDIAGRVACSAVRRVSGWQGRERGERCLDR